MSIVRGTMRLGAPTLLLALFLGCSSNEASRPFVAQDEALLVRQTVQTIGAVPRFARTLSAARVARVEGSHLVIGPDESSRTETLGAWLPTRAGDPMRVFDAKDPDGVWIDVKPLATTPAKGTLHEGRALVLRDVALDTDVLHLATRSMVEELRVLRSPRASSAARYELRVGPRVSSVRLNDGQVEVVDGTGFVRLRTAPALAVDARGRERTVAVSLRAGEAGFVLETTLDTAGLEYPIVVDPAWISAANMQRSHQRHAITTLTDGRALVATNGGASASTSCETFTPGTNTWTLVASAPQPFGTGVDAVTFTAGTRAGWALVAGAGFSNDAGAMYNAAGNAWTPTPVPSPVLSSVSLVLLADGKRALAVPGNSASALIFNSETTGTGTAGGWTAGGTMAAVRFGHAAVRLTDGRVLVTGGRNASSTILATSEIYNPATNTWATTTSMPGARMQHSATLISGGRVLVAGGASSAGEQKTAWTFDPATSVWTTVGSLAVARAGHMAVATATGKVLVVGSDYGTNTQTAELYDPTANVFRTAGALSELRPGGRATLISTGVLVTGGDDPSSSSPSKAAEIFAPAALGAACGIGDDCESGACVNGVCCSSASCATGMRCDIAPKKGTCSYPQGTACTGATQCASGLCVDGRCCDATCTGQCEACNVAGKEGTCSPVIGAPVGTRLACGGSASTDPCAKQYCDGSDRTKCYYPAAGIVDCGSNACTGTTETHLAKCNGAGACGDVAKSCGDYTCGATRCKTSCAANADCVSGRYCDTTRGECVPYEGLGRKCSDVVPCTTGLSCTNGFCCGVAKCEEGASCGVPGKEGTCTRVNGSACKVDAECGSAHCVDGVCCDRACDGQCEACDVFDPTTGLAGKCIPISGAPHGTRKACDVGADVCGTKQCDGKTVASCQSLVGSDVVCRTQNCAGGVQTLEAKCDGSGACPAVVTKPCGTYACNIEGLACETGCTTNDQCALGYRCQGGACIEPTDRCSEDLSKSITKDGVETPCTPYACRTDGKCGSTCTITNDCAKGNICSSGACVPTPTPSADEGDGGGCTMGARSGRSGLSLSLFALVLGAFVWRRRALTVASVAALSLGCSQKTAQTEPVGKGRSVALVVDEVRGFGTLGAGIDKLHPIVKQGAGFALLDERSALHATIPARADGVTRLESARDPQVWAEIRATDLPARDGQQAEGAIVYPGDEQDVIVLPSPGRLEEVRLVRKEALLHVARYELRVGPGVAKVRLREGHVEVVDATGYVHFATEPMEAWDARGERRKVEATLALDGDVYRLETRLDATGLRHPIAIDPAWNAVASMNDDRLSHRMIPLPDGRVMVIGGSYLGGLLRKECEIYDPVTNVWTSVAPMAKARWGHAAERLTSGPLAGRIVVFGGVNGGDATVWSSTEIYNVATNTWTAGPTMKVARQQPSSALVAGGSKVFVTEGSTGELYDSATGVGTTTSATNTMSVVRQDPGVMLLGTGNVLVFGGTVSGTPTASANLYNPTTNGFSAAASMPAARGKALYAMAGTKVFVTGGTTDGSTALATSTQYDPATNTWGAAASMTIARLDGRAVTLQSGRILAVGGSTSTDSEVYDPVSNTWAGSGFYSRQRSSFELALLVDGSAVMTGGISLGKSVANVDRFAPGPLGNACTSGYECLSGYCTNGVCCSTGTCATGALCNRPKTLGTCTKALGTTCSAGTECESGFCVDGVCCNVACGGQCQSCNQAGKLGTCFAVKGAPTGGRTACAAATSSAPCAAQTCDGFDGTKCHYLAAGTTACGAVGCSAGVATTAGTCNGAGACNDTSKSCGAYTCSGTKCATTCASTTDCAAGFYCNTATSTCVVNEGLGQKCSTTVPCKSGLTCVDGYCCGSASCPTGSTCGWFGKEGTCTKTNGGTCTTDVECGSGHCVDGVCCDSACTGQCEACDIVEAATGRAGRCLPVVGAPHGTRTACASDPANECSGSQCGGDARDKCTVFVGTWKTCRVQACKDSTVTLPAQCDGKGGCPAAVTASCDAYACTEDGTRCKTSCSKPSDCATGYYCSVDKCVKRAADCSQDKLSSIPNGGTAVPCSPYLCVDSGTCGSSCHTSDECAAGFVCDPSGSCVAPPASEDSGGCGYGHGGTAGLSGLGLALSLALLSRRRR